MAECGGVERHQNQSKITSPSCLLVFSPETVWHVLISRRVATMIIQQSQWTIDIVYEVTRYIEPILTARQLTNVAN